MRNSELEFFEETLLKRKKQILSNLKGVESELNAISELEINDDGDSASLSSSNSLENAIAKQQVQELSEIEVALAKIKQKRYGICEMCEENISIARLKVKPHALYCIDCRSIVEKSK